MRKNLLFATLFITLILFSGALNAQEPGSACKDITLASMQKHVPIPPANILSQHEVNGICEVILDINGQYVPVYAGKNFIIAGEMFQDKKQITQSRIDALKAEDFVLLKPEIEKCVAFTLTPQKEPKHTIYIITDPVCPFCHQAEIQLKEFGETHSAQFKIIMSSVHPPVGRQKAIEAVCRKLSLDDYVNGKWKDEDKTDQFQCPEGTALIESSEKLTSALGIDGVPVFYLEDGQRIDGADMPAIANALSDKPEKVSDAK
jgi:thiol:disulfide interchange protein DsbC